MTTKQTIGSLERRHTRANTYCSIFWRMAFGEVRQNKHRRAQQ